MPVLPRLQPLAPGLHEDFAATARGWLHRLREPLQCCFNGVRTLRPRTGSAMIRTTLKGLSMEKWLCWGSLGVSGILLALFILDIAIRIPFGRISMVVDILGAAACALVAYLSWDAAKDLR